MNIQLSGTEEFIDGKSTGSLGQVLIRYFYIPLFPPPLLLLLHLHYLFVLPTGQLMYKNEYRCNNVLWISGAKDTKQEDTAMDG